MALVLGIGIGLFLLIFIWTVALFLCLALSRAKGGAGFGAVAVLLLATLITLILWFIPREPPEGTVEEVKVYDYFFIARVTLLTFFSVMLLAGGVFLMSVWIAEPIRAKSLKTKRL